MAAVRILKSQEMGAVGVAGVGADGLDWRLRRVWRGARGGPLGADKIGALVGRLFAKNPVGKFFTTRVEDGAFLWVEDVAAAVAQEEALDGCYVIKTTASAEALDKEQVVAHYKGLARVETAFRNFKSASLEIRPVHPKKEERIRAHIFLSLLAYYLQSHAQDRLASLFDEEKAKGSAHSRERHWTWMGEIEVLKSLREEVAEIEGIRFNLKSAVGGNGFTQAVVLRGWAFGQSRRVPCGAWSGLHDAQTPNSLWKPPRFNGTF